MTSYTAQEIVGWLNEMAQGRLHLDHDNIGLAASTLGLIHPSVPAPALPPGFLSPHFTLAEFVHSDTANAQGIDNCPSAAVVEKLTVLACLMEEVRTICGSHPVIISSGYRCRALNAAIGGAEPSAHEFGCACDFTIPAYGSAHAVFEKLKPLVKQLGVDQLIDERGGGAAWVHIAKPIPPRQEPRHQCFALG